MAYSRAYIFTSTRLGFRNWLDDDIEKMVAINSDKRVMEFFPDTVSPTDTIAFIKRMQEQYADKGFCYFAVDRLDLSEFIGFIGLTEQVFPADFTPCVDIGWRLDSSTWNQGFATEGALRCLDFGFSQAGLATIYSMAPVVNHKSIRIMEKIGMQKVQTFNHPKLINNKRLETCVLYQIHSSK